MCIQVARSTRAWIETANPRGLPEAPRVARSTRAWIETGILRQKRKPDAKSHALRVRGLKPTCWRFEQPPSVVARSTRAWIETTGEKKSIGELLSHALRVRGLKQKDAPEDAAGSRSHALRVRGLKLEAVLLMSAGMNGRTLYACVD